MDRDNRWERVKLAFDLLTKGQGKPTQDIVQSIQNSYDDGVTDEFIKQRAKDRKITSSQYLNNNLLNLRLMTG